VGILGSFGGGLLNSFFGGMLKSFLGGIQTFNFSSDSSSINLLHQACEIAI